MSFIADENFRSPVESFTEHGVWPLPPLTVDLQPPFADDDEHSE